MHSKQRRELYLIQQRSGSIDSFMKDGKEVLIKRDLWFVDSLRLLAFNLDASSKNLGNNQSMNMNNYYRGKQFEMLRKNGVYHASGQISKD